MIMQARNISVLADDSQLIKDIELELKPGELTALIGPNGAGKTTLLRTLLGLIQPDTGQVTLNGMDVQKLSPIKRARQIAYLPQTRLLAWPNIVSDVVALGRFAFGTSPAKLNPSDKALIEDVMIACDIQHLSERRANSLSGGELARVHCARTFAAQAPFLIADEPVAALDPRHQIRIMKLIKNYVSPARGALVVLHDINLAAQYADRLIWMKNARIIADGSPQDTLTNERMADVFKVKACINKAHILIEDAL